MDRAAAERRLEAAAYLRGDLPLLRRRTYSNWDAAIDQTINGQDVKRAAEHLEALLKDEHDLVARLDTYTRDIERGGLPTIVRGVDARPPGDPGAVVITVWACPEGDTRRIQYEANQDLGVCTKHGLPLEPETSRQ